MTSPINGIRKRIVLNTDSVTGMPSEECWVDIYELAWFEGKLRRFRGPGKYRSSDGWYSQAGSIIVGPVARLEAFDREHRISLGPRRIVPDLTHIGLAGELREFEIKEERMRPRRSSRWLRGRGNP